MVKRKNTKAEPSTAPVKKITTKKSVNATQPKIKKQTSAEPAQKKTKTSNSNNQTTDEKITIDKQIDENALELEGFDWTGINNRVDSSDEEQESSDEEEEEEIKGKRLKKKEVEDLTAELNEHAPQNAHEFERLLVGSPNSSYLWINYMAYELKLSEIDKARDVGERALKTINFREEQEKMNVWVALLNLENNFGSEDTLQEVFKRAIIYCEPIKVYQQMTEIYERTDKLDKAELVWQEMCKKFGQRSDVWTGFGLFLLQQDKTEKAREVLQKSLRILPKHEHIQTVLKFAQLEFKYGESERGRTLLEGIVSNNPKRLDLWSVYLDMEVKAGDVDMTRRLFERVSSMKFSSKKMKFIFKKWLLFEKGHGSEDDVQKVKERTLAYVESMS
ncbi:hypothetical protein G6F56_006482 [Rhizopus delemar]|uniref:rRNA bioproteinsis protein rrp5 n=1 Tax=Rhizopus stolonifer TaxID=4846 RepID=A0A367KHZ2_RHIST|nr:hypothetical protein G6F56_006482 [Rhizopus delemar]RCI01826.1 rRNA bioproteinsis protein rrp5 [Rhizopus stolonifer]